MSMNVLRDKLCQVGKENSTKLMQQSRPPGAKCGHECVSKEKNIL
jgi:hypothetical protein